MYIDKAFAPCWQGRAAKRIWHLSEFVHQGGSSSHKVWACRLRLRVSLMSFSSSEVCSFGWWCGRFEWSAKDSIVPTQRAFQKYIYERLLLYLRDACFSPYFSQYFIRDWRNRISCYCLTRGGLADTLYQIIINLKGLNYSCNISINQQPPINRAASCTWIVCFCCEKNTTRTSDILNTR